MTYHNESLKKTKLHSAKRADDASVTAEFGHSSKMLLQVHSKTAPFVCTTSSWISCEAVAPQRSSTVLEAQFFSSLYWLKTETTIQHHLHNIAQYALGGLRIPWDNELFYLRCDKMNATLSAEDNPNWQQEHKVRGKVYADGTQLNSMRNCGGERLSNRVQFFRNI